MGKRGPTSGFRGTAREAWRLLRDTIPTAKTAARELWDRASFWGSLVVLLTPAAAALGLGWIAFAFEPARPWLVSAGIFLVLLFSMAASARRRRFRDIGAARKTLFMILAERDLARQANLQLLADFFDHDAAVQRMADVLRARMIRRGTLDYGNALDLLVEIGPWLRADFRAVFEIGGALELAPWGRGRVTNHIHAAQGFIEALLCEGLVIFQPASRENQGEVEPLARSYRLNDLGEAVRAEGAKHYVQPSGEPLP